MADNFDPIHLGRADVDEGDQVQIQRNLISGRAVIVPRSVGRLSGLALDVVSDLQRTAVIIEQAQERLAGIVLDARDAGVSWAAIGWSVGTSGEAARQRWGLPPEAPGF